MYRKDSVTAGLTLIEVLVAMTILGVVMAAITSGILANANINSQIERRNDAIRISEDVLEDYRQTGAYVGLQNSPPRLSTVIRKDQTYSIKTSFCPSDTPSNMPCSNTAVYIRVEVSNNGKILQRSDTYYTTFGQE